MAEPIKPAEQIARLWGEVDRDLAVAVAVASTEQVAVPAVEQPPADPVRREIWRL